VFDIEKPPSSGSGMGLSTAVLIGAVIRHAGRRCLFVRPGQQRGKTDSREPPGIGPERHRGHAREFYGQLGQRSPHPWMP